VREEEQCWHHKRLQHCTRTTVHIKECPTCLVIRLEKRWIEWMREKERERTHSLKTVKWRQANNQFVLGWLGANHGPNRAQGPLLAALILHPCHQHVTVCLDRWRERERNQQLLGIKELPWRSKSDNIYSLMSSDLHPNANTGSQG